MDSVVKTIFTRRVRKVLAFVLAGVMVFSIAVTGLSVLSKPTINAQARSVPRSDAATRYLAEKTDYVQESVPTRIVEYLKTRQEPSALEEYYSLAGVQIAQEDFGDALVSVEKCIELYDGEGEELLTDLWLKKSCLHVILEQYEDALAAMEKVLELDDTIAESYLVLAQIMVEFEDPERLIQALESYLALRPDDEEIRELLAGLLVEYLDYDGMREYTETYIQPAAEEYAQAATAEYVPPEPTVETYFLQGLFAIQDGDFEDAVTCLTQALEFDENYEGVRYYRGISRLVLLDYEGAIEDFSASIENGHMVQASYYKRGIAEILADMYEAGVEDIVAASQLDEDPEILEQAEQFLEEVEKAEAEAAIIAHLLRAQACADLFDYAGMAENLELYLEAEPDDTEIWEMLARARFANNEFSEALALYEWLLESDRSADNLYVYGLTALQMSDYVLAAQALTEAIKLDGGISGAYYYRGVCSLSLEDYEEAEADFTISITRSEFVQSCYFNRGISRLMQEKNDPGLSDVRLAAALMDDPEVALQAELLLQELHDAGVG